MEHSATVTGNLVMRAACAMPCVIYTVAQVVAGTGDGLLPFADDLIACLKKCFHLKSKTATSHVARVSVVVFVGVLY